MEHFDLMGRLFSRWRREPSRVVLVVHSEPVPVPGSTPGDRGARREVDGAALLEEVARQSHRVRAFRERGGVALGLCAPNGLELVAVLIAALEAGLAVAPLSLELPTEEVAERARLFGLDAVWSGAHCSQERDFSLDVALRPSLPEGAALLLSTSGTTGEPRAVVIGRDGLSRHTLGLADEVMGLGEEDRVLAALPLAHSFGCRMALLVPLACGAVVHIVSRFSARATFGLIEREGLTFAPVVPTMLSAWCAVPRSETTRTSLRWILSAGAPLPAGLRARAEAHLGCEVREGYGLTEASFCTIDGPGLDGSQYVPGTVGRPTPGVQVRLAEDGEVMVRGPNLMSGYLGDPAGTDAAIVDGWLRTGDLGRWRGERLEIVDRLKDIVLTGGFTVYPAEVERALSHVEGVAGCAVFGLPDPHLGERVAAAIVWTSEVAHEVAERLLEAEAGRHLPRHAVPSRWFFVTELPLGASRKVQKRKLREALGGAAGARGASRPEHG